MFYLLTETQFLRTPSLLSRSLANLRSLLKLWQSKYTVSNKSPLFTCSLIFKKNPNKLVTRKFGFQEAPQPFSSVSYFGFMPLKCIHYLSVY